MDQAENTTEFDSLPKDSPETISSEQKKPSKRRIAIFCCAAAFLLIVIAVFAVVLISNSEYRKFKSLRSDYVDRVADAEGLEVDEIVEYENVHYFTVRVCLNTDGAEKIDDLVWFEASFMYFENSEEADAAYKNNSVNPMGTCLKEGNILALWMTGDPFEDLYTEVFNQAFGR